MNYPVNKNALFDFLFENGFTLTDKGVINGNGYPFVCKGIHYRIPLPISYVDSYTINEIDVIIDQIKLSKEYFEEHVANYALTTNPNL